MNYTAFEQMETSPLVRQKEEPAQDYMERIFRVACGPAEGGQDRPVRVNDMLEPEFVSCSEKEQRSIQAKSLSAALSIVRL